MSLTQVERKYEILIRFHADGTIGAHQSSIAEFFDGDQILTAKILGPFPLATKEGDEGQQLVDFLGEATVDALAANSQLTAELEQKNLMIESLQEQILQLTPNQAE